MSTLTATCPRDVKAGRLREGTRVTVLPHKDGNKKSKSREGEREREGGRTRSDGTQRTGETGTAERRSRNSADKAAVFQFSASTLYTVRGGA